MGAQEYHCSACLNDPNIGHGVGLDGSQPDCYGHVCKVEPTGDWASELQDRVALRDNAAALEKMCAEAIETGQKLAAERDALRAEVAALKVANKNLRFMVEALTVDPLEIDAARERGRREGREEAQPRPTQSFSQTCCEEDMCELFRCEKAVEAEVAAAVAEERERAALLAGDRCSGLLCRWDTPTGMLVGGLPTETRRVHERGCAVSIASAIRSRGETQGSRT